MPKTLATSKTDISGKANTNQTMYIGTTAHVLNRASASEDLAGITSLTPGANFTLAQNSVNVLTSESASAVVNTLYLKAGNVGIGTTGPNYKLEISTDSAGKPGIGGLWTVVSDERIKTEIELADLDRCYEIIKSVPLKRFGWAEGVYTDEQVKDRHGLGWIAQDVQKVFPKAVNTVPFTKKFDTGEVEEYEEPVLDEKGEAVLVDDKPQVEIKTRPVIREEVIEDCLDLNSGQLIAALYGAVQKLQLDVEKLKNSGSKIIAETPVEPMEEVIKG